jgi:pimeloyl-ACP methyl ester carboxylesterase
MTEKMPLLLLPGLLCDGRLWEAQIAALGDVAEGQVPDLSRDDSITAMASRTLAAAPERFALAGLSMGGYVAQEIARQAPERVARLALLDTSARADTPEQTKRRRDLMELSERGRFHGISAQLLPFLVHPDRVQESALIDIVIAMAAAIGADGFRRQETAIMNRRDGRADLARIAVPTLVLCGREDALTPPPLSREMAALIPRAQLRLIDRCGHLTTLERPAKINAAMREWLA